MEDLPLGRIAALVPEFAGPALVQNNDDDDHDEGEKFFQQNCHSEWDMGPFQNWRNKTAIQTVDAFWFPK